ncbi:MAG: ABC transporter permease [Dehalococcoidia bacterium]
MSSDEMAIEALGGSPAGAALEVSPRRGVRRRLGRWVVAILWELIPPLVALGLLVGGWWAYVEIDDTPDYIAPSPDQVWDELVDRPDFYVDHAWFTLKNALAGLAIGATVALVLATAMAHSRLIEKGLFPVAIIVKVTPIVAIAPLFTIWWGFGVEPKIAVAALISFFPILVNAIVGFRSVEPAALDFMRSINASRFEVFSKLRLPSSLPYLIAAMRVSVPLSIIGAVVAEWFGAAEGLGRLVQVANANLDLPTLFAAIVVLALMGIALNLLLSIADRLLLGWHASSRT